MKSVTLSHASVSTHWNFLNMDNRLYLCRRKASFLVVCMALMAQGSMAYGQECGENPMRRVLMVAKQSDRSVTHVLNLLRTIDSPAYESLAGSFRVYAACVGLVDTGYFRKRGGSDFARIDALSPFEQTMSKSKPHSMISSLTTALQHLRKIYEELAQRRDRDQKRVSADSWSHVPSLWLHDMKRMALPDKEVADDDAWDEEDQYR